MKCPLIDLINDPCVKIRTPEINLFTREFWRHLVGSDFRQLLGRRRSGKHFWQIMVESTDS